MNPIQLGTFIKVLKYLATTTTGNVINLCDLTKELACNLETLPNYYLIIYISPNTKGTSCVISDTWVLGLSDANNTVEGEKYTDSFDDGKAFPFVLPLNAQHQYLNFDFASWGVTETHQAHIFIYVMQTENLDTNIPKGVSS